MLNKDKSYVNGKWFSSINNVKNMEAEGGNIISTSQRTSSLTVAKYA
jgi:hypothetical protein